MLYGTGLANMRTWIRDDVVKRMNTAGDLNVHFLEFEMQDGKDGYGSAWHPNLITHARMAGELVASIKQVVPEFGDLR